MERPCLSALIREAERIAQENGGELTLLLFPSGWRVLGGSPPAKWEQADCDVLDALPKHATLKAALLHFIEHRPQLGGNEG